MSWGLLLVLVSLVGVKTTKQSSGQFMIKRGIEKSAKQPSNVVGYSFDLNKTPPRESNEEIKPLSIKKGSNQKKIKGSTKGKPGRPKKYASEEARKIANIENRKNYRKQFTKKGIEEAKKVLQGEELNKFLLKAENYKEQARERQRRLKNIRTFKRTADESQRVAQRALGFMKR